MDYRDPGFEIHCSLPCLDGLEHPDSEVRGYNPLRDVNGRSSCHVSWIKTQ